MLLRLAIPSRALELVPAQSALMPPSTEVGVDCAKGGREGNRGKRLEEGWPWSRERPRGTTGESAGR